MKRSTLTAALFFAGVAAAHAGGSSVSTLFKWNTGADSPTITIEYVDKILVCPNGSLQTGHTESTGKSDYRWMWDDCPKEIPQVFIVPGLYSPKDLHCEDDDLLLKEDQSNWREFRKCFFRKWKKESSDRQVIILDGDTITTTGKITVK